MTVVIASGDGVVIVLKNNAQVDVDVKGNDRAQPEFATPGVLSEAGGLANGGLQGDALEYRVSRCETRHHGDWNAP